MRSNGRTWMKAPSFGQLRFAVLFFVVFFAISAVGQYLFVGAQTEGILVRDMRQGADSENKAISFDNGVDLKSYRQSWADIGDFVVVLDDGTVLDASFFRGSVPPGLFPAVEFPIQDESLFRTPISISFVGGGETCGAMDPAGQAPRQGLLDTRLFRVRPSRSPGSRRAGHGQEDVGRVGQ